ALEHCPNVTTCLVVRHTGGHINWNEKHDIWYHAMAEKVDADCPAEEMDAEDPLFILYTSGSTGKPKGVLHTTAGYLLGAAMTHKYLPDYREGDMHLWTAGVRSVSVHPYSVYGPPANGATTLRFGGGPTRPHGSH